MNISILCESRNLKLVASNPKSAGILVNRKFFSVSLSGKQNFEILKYKRPRKVKKKKLNKHSKNKKQKTSYQISPDEISISRTT